MENILLNHLQNCKVEYISYMHNQNKCHKDEIYNPIYITQLCEKKNEQIRIYNLLNLI